MADWLLERGADMNKHGYLDWTPMSFAVENAPPDFIQDLIGRGGDVRKGELLFYALERDTGSVPVLELLLDRGADIDAVMYDDDPESFRFNHGIERNTPL